MNAPIQLALCPGIGLGRVVVDHRKHIFERMQAVQERVVSRGPGGGEGLVIERAEMRLSEAAQGRLHAARPAVEPDRGIGVEDRGKRGEGDGGRTLNDAFVILDEAQNTTSEQMKMFLTRLGFGSKAVITGDITQIDLPPAARRASSRR